MPVARSTESRGAHPTVPVIGLEASEVHWVRVLIALLRHADPAVPELTRHALEYLTNSAAGRTVAEAEPLDHTG
jgi:hypothetical protein